MEEFVISYDSQGNLGSLFNSSSSSSSAWQRITSSAVNLDVNSVIANNQLRLPWYQLLSLLREYIPQQKQLKFKFVTDDTSKSFVQRFVQEQKATAEARKAAIQIISESEVVQRIRSLGFTLRDLREFQIRDAAILSSIPNGANFSVPGAGKTTVTLAIHLLACEQKDKLLVICPKSAFPAWNEIIDQCIDANAGWAYSRFTNISKNDDREIVGLFQSDAKYFVTNYEQFVAKKDTFSFLLATNSVHLVLDESHRMKAGQLSLRGAALLSVANLPKRKDILSGTPMPQGPEDLQAQLEFLWPGSSLGLRIQRGELPREVISGLYTRTTKEELNIPPATRRFIQVPMTPEQSALYGIVKNDVLRQLSSFKDRGALDIIKARKSVLRLLQLASNPVLAVRGISEDIFLGDHGVINAIVQNPRSPKIDEACRLVRLNSRNNRKTVVWTIFTQNIIDLETRLSDLNPVSLYGQVKSGDEEDDQTREWRLKKFHNDETCRVLIANPAAAGEGISLHTVCHEAIYLDRSYVSTHYLQSLDRIHRLGLLPGTETNITIIQAAAPAGLGSIDYSVSRRLGTKIRALEQLLNDRDLHLIALDEENSPDAVDYKVDKDDIIDLIAELEGHIFFDENEGL